MTVLIRPDWARDFTMKRIRFTAEQIIRRLKTAEQLIAQGKTVSDVCRAIEVTKPTYHRWKQQYGGMQSEEAKRLAQNASEAIRERWAGASWIIELVSTGRRDGRAFLPRPLFHHYPSHQPESPAAACAPALGDRKPVALAS